MKTEVITSSTSTELLHHTAVARAGSVSMIFLEFQQPYRKLASVVRCHRLSSHFSLTRCRKLRFSRKSVYLTSTTLTLPVKSAQLLSTTRIKRLVTPHWVKSFPLIARSRGYGATYPLSVGTSHIGAQLQIATIATQCMDPRHASDGRPSNVKHGPLTRGHGIGLTGR